MSQVRLNYIRLLAVLLMPVTLWATVWTVPAWAQRQFDGFGLSETAEAGLEAERDQKAAQDLAQRLLDLPLTQRVAQLMFVRLEGRLHPSTEDTVMLRHYPPGGVVVPAVVDNRVSAEYARTLRGMPVETELGLPLFIAARLNVPREQSPTRITYFSELPSAMTVGGAFAPETERALYTIVAERLNAMGFNTFLGPDLTLAPTMAQAHRSVDYFSSAPSRNGQLAQTIIGALAEHELLAMPIGFPGGEANRRPGEAAVLLSPAPLLADKELQPYRQAIAAGAQLVHVGLTLVPTLDNINRPACCSPIVVQGLLRDSLGFEGVIVAGPVDRWDMKAHANPTTAAIEALRAGADMVYWSDGGTRVMRAVEEIVKAIESEELDETIIDRAIQRVARVKMENKLGERPVPVGEKAAKRGEDKELVNQSYELERRAVTLVKNSNGILPLTVEDSMPIGITGVTGVIDLHDALEEYIKPIARQRMTTARHLGTIEDFEILRLTRRAAGLKTLIVVLTDSQDGRDEQRLVRQLREVVGSVIVVLLGHPALLPELEDADAIVTTYCGDEPKSSTMRAVADILAGHAPLGLIPPETVSLRTQVNRTEALDIRTFVAAPAGRLPVATSDDYPAGHGLTYDATRGINKVQWVFSNGRKASGMTTECHFAEPGDYEVEIHVTDSSKRAIQQTYPLVVEP